MLGSGLIAVRPSSQGLGRPVLPILMTKLMKLPAISVPAAVRGQQHLTLRGTECEGWCGQINFV